MAKEISKVYKVMVVPKDLKQIPDVLPYNQFISGDPKEVELNKSEILRCMNFGDVYLMEEGEAAEEPINSETFKDLEYFEEGEPAENEEEPSDSEGSDNPSQSPTGEEQVSPQSSIPDYSYSTPVTQSKKEDTESK